MSSRLELSILWLMVMVNNMEFSLAYVRPYLTCTDNMYTIPGHTMCIAETKHRPFFKERHEIVKAHDTIRAAVVPRAANMMTLLYTTALEKEAQIWAEQCKLKHDEEHLRAMPGRYMVGQNLLISPTNLTMQQVVDEWAKEKIHFNYGQKNDINIVGNYTQIILAETTSFGCGKALCGSLYFYVCNYAPSSNLATKIDQPYKASASGVGADDCPLHVSNDFPSLCYCRDRLCINGGRVNLTTCACDCPPDTTNSRYSQGFCELTCKPSTDPAPCQNKTKAQCITEADTFLTCPWLCNGCPYAGMNYNQGDVTMPWITTTPKTTTTLTPPSTSTVSTTSASTTSNVITTITSPFSSQLAHNTGIRLFGKELMFALCLTIQMFV